MVYTAQLVGASLQWGRVGGVQCGGWGSIALVEVAVFHQKLQRGVKNRVQIIFYWLSQGIMFFLNGQESVSK